MLGWLDFLLCLFWLALGGFVFNVANFVTLMLYAEFTWLVLYGISVVIGAQLDDVTVTSLTFFILGFGGLEFAIGLMLIVMLKNFLNYDKLNFNVAQPHLNKNWNV